MYTWTLSLLPSMFCIFDLSAENVAFVFEGSSSSIHSEAKEVSGVIIHVSCRHIR